MSGCPCAHCIALPLQRLCVGRRPADLSSVSGNCRAAQGLCGAGRACVWWVVAPTSLSHLGSDFSGCGATTPPVHERVPLSTRISVCFNSVPVITNSLGQHMSFTHCKNKMCDTKHWHNKITILLKGCALSAVCGGWGSDEEAADAAGALLAALELHAAP